MCAVFYKCGLIFNFLLKRFVLLVFVFHLIGFFSLELCTTNCNFIDVYLDNVDMVWSVLRNCDRHSSNANAFPESIN